MNRDPLFVERSEDGDYAVKRANQHRSIGLFDTQSEAIDRAKSLTDGPVHVERDGTRNLAPPISGVASSDQPPMNAGGFSRFAWPSKTFDFPIDERLDPVLFELGFSALGFLDQSLDGLRLSHDDPAYASRILLIYLASRIYGATAAALMLLAHELGREAIMAGRTQYECYIKMLYYDHFHDKATATLENIDAYNFKFGKRLGVDPSSVYSQEELDALEELARRTDLNFKNQVVECYRKTRTCANLPTAATPLPVGF